MIKLINPLLYAFIGGVLSFSIFYYNNLTIISINEYNKEKFLQLDNKLNSLLSKNKFSIEDFKKHQKDLFIEFNEPLNNNLLLTIEELKKINTKPSDSKIQENIDKARKYDQLTSTIDIKSIDSVLKRALSGNINEMMYICSIGTTEIKKQCLDYISTEKNGETFKRANLIGARNWHGELQYLEKIYISTVDTGIKYAVLNASESSDSYGLDNIEKQQFNNFLADSLIQEKDIDTIRAVFTYFGKVDEKRIPELVRSLNGNIPPELKNDLDYYADRVKQGLVQ